MEEKSPKAWTKENAKDRITKYCLYQERCIKEIYDKLANHHIYDPYRQKIIDYLIEEGFVDEYRYATAIVKGKYHRLKWGTLKIRAFLSKKSIPQPVIDAAIKNEILEEDTIEKVTAIITRKVKNVDGNLDLKTKAKIFSFLYNKGYEPSTINQAWEIVQKEKNHNM